jgi:hypothetical protein
MTYDERTTMPRLFAELAAALRRPARPDTSHVHPGAAGSSAVCNDPQCLARRNTT